jgi:hypothetical protein
MAEHTIDVTGGHVGYDEASPVLLRCTAPDALSNLVAVLELAADGQLRYGTASRRPTAATVKLVEDVLVAGDYYEDGEPIAAVAWPALLQIGGLTQQAGTTVELTRRGEATLAEPSYQALSALWGRWLSCVSHDELARVEAIKGQRKPSTLTSGPQRRAAVATALASVDPGTWIESDDLLATLRAQRTPLVVARSLLARYRLYLIDSYYGSLGNVGHRAWSLVEGRYALCVLFEYAATMGVIDVAYTDPAGARGDYRDIWGGNQLAWLSRYDGLVAVRVNELGAAILHDPSAVPRLGLPEPRPSALAPVRRVQPQAVLWRRKVWEP